MRIPVLLLIFVSSALRADNVERTVLRDLLTQSVTAAGLSPYVATAGDGTSIVAWVVRPFTATAAIQYVILNPDGSTRAPGVLTLATGTRVVWQVSVAATATSFAIVYDAQPNATNTNRDVFLAIIDRTVGAVLAQNQANTLTNFDENLPRAAGTITGNYVMVWRRNNLNATSPGGLTRTEGVYIRRFTGAGIAIDSAEIRADIATSNFGDQAGVAIGAWRDRIVVSWHDGVFDGPPSANGSPDGWGQGIVARWFNAPIGGAITALTGHIRVATSTDRDQFEPIIEVDHRNTCVIGWCGDTGATFVDAYCRRFDDNGVALDVNETNLTPGDNTNSQFLMDVGMSSHGEAVCSWMSTPSTAGQPAARIGFARLDQSGFLVENGFVESGGSAGESHAFPRLGVDEYGNFVCAFQVTAGTAGTVRFARFERNVLTISPAVGALGQIHILNVDSPSDFNRVFVIAASLGSGPIPIDTRNAKLSADFVLQVSVFGPPLGVFFDFAGVLDPIGRSNPALPPFLIIPQLPALRGATFSFVVATDGPGAPSGINTISDAVTLTIL